MTQAAPQQGLQCFEPSLLGDALQEKTIALQTAIETRSSFMEILMRATVFASQKHAGQLRHGGKNIPYINHALEVANRVAESGGSLKAVCAAVLHDVMEECKVTAEEMINPS